MGKKGNFRYQQNSKMKQGYEKLNKTKTVTYKKYNKGKYQKSSGSKGKSKRTKNKKNIQDLKIIDKILFNKFRLDQSNL